MKIDDKESAELRELVSKSEKLIEGLKADLYNTGHALIDDAVETLIEMRNVISQRLPAESAQGEDDTPRTDASLWQIKINGEDAVSAEVSRELERELNRYKSLWEACHPKHETERQRRMELEAELAKIKREGYAPEKGK